jgi:hypothetical protein
MWKSFRPVGSVAGIERDGAADFVDLQTVAVELDLVDPTDTLGQALMQDRLAGDDEWGARHTGRLRLGSNATPEPFGMEGGCVRDRFDGFV